jgi:DNA polymerase
MEEMEGCYKHLSKEIDFMTPKIILLLGKQVASFILKSKGVKEFELDEEFNYKPILIDGIYYLPVHHPSYVLIYKRKYLQNYTAKIKRFLERYHYQEAMV